MRHQNICNMDESKDQALCDEEGCNKCLKTDEMPLTSTPIKINDRRSVSLSDISQIGSNLEMSKTHISSDTLGSNSSICKDSGYNHSESSLSSDKVKEEINPFPVNYRDKYFRLLEDSKFMDVMITSLYESNYSLRMKIAEAENKIFELRLKSESHCKCCANKSPDSSVEYLSPDSSKYQYKYSVSPLTKSEPCLLVSPPTKQKTKHNSIKGFTKDESSTLQNENTFIKVKEWQNTYKECQKIVSNIPPKTPSPPNEPSKIFFRPIPEPLPHPMSYMETSRALAETYRRRQEKSSDLFSLQVIGNHSVAVSPVTFIKGFHGAEERDKYLNDLGENRSDPLQLSRKGTHEESSLKKSLLGNIFLKNQKSNSLSDCLSKAQEYAASLTIGLSKIPRALDENRSLSAQMK